MVEKKFKFKTIDTGLKIYVQAKASKCDAIIREIIMLLLEIFRYVSNSTYYCWMLQRTFEKVINYNV